MKHEAQFQTLFKRWLQARWTGGAAAFELKRTLTYRLPLSAVKEHQRDALLASHRDGYYYKIPDDSYGQKPYDCFFMREVEAYVVIAFGPKLKQFHMVSIDEWESLCAVPERKSIHEDELVGISKLVII